MRGTREVLDEMLVLSCQSGDSQALELLARRWHPRLLRCAYRVTGNPDAAAEATQEAWIGIVRGIRGLRDPARFGVWALRIVRNKGRDWIRSERRRRRALAQVEAEALPTPALDGGSDTALGADHAGAVSALRAAMRELSDEQRTVLRLFYVEGLTVGEIAAVTGRPPGTVKSRLFYARRRMREATERAEGTVPAQGERES